MKTYFVGIGGIGMSALAGILHEQGGKIEGTDQEASSLISSLIHKGIPVRIKSEHLPQAVSRVVYSLAIPSSHPLLKEARARRIPTMSYPEAVGELTRNYYTIAVCGTHGKSTITSLLAKIFIENGFDPTVIVGTKIQELGGSNYRVGKSKLFILEACEYKRAFLNYRPRVIVLNTLDPDHLDYYRTFEDYLSAFNKFSALLPADGYFFAQSDDPDVASVLQWLEKKRFPHYNTFTYGVSENTFSLKGSTVFHRGSEVGTLNLKIPGAHNRLNALGAFAVCRTLGVAPKEIIKSLDRYEGAYRRFQMKGHVGKAVVIDDYAHHPVEIRATLQAARERYPKARICAVFQPHQYSRTKKLFNEFVTAFGDADHVIIPNIYEVRDSKKDVASVSAEQLVAAINKHAGAGSAPLAEYGEGIAGTVELLKKNTKRFGVILTMGAGDVWKIADGLTS